MAIGVSYGYMMFTITYAEIIIANFNLMATEAVMELQIRDHLVLEGDINEIIEFLAVFGSRPKESSECAEGDINKIIEFLAVVAILSGFEMLQATFLAWSLWVVLPISQASAVKHISPSVIGNPHLTTVDGILHGLHSPWMQTLLRNLLL